jgi:hypothetical protein
MENKANDPEFPKEHFFEGAGKVLSTIAEKMEYITALVRRTADQMVSDFNEYQMLSYSNVMGYFSKYQKDPRIVMAALVKEPLENGGFRVYRVFLDKDHNLITKDEQGKPLGYKQTTKSLDAELTALFNGHNVIIVE